MKIIDFERKGNMVRFYLGEDDCNDYWGDDWNDTPYEYNAGTVYDSFVKDTVDIVFPFDWLVLEPGNEDYGNSGYCKEDMIRRIVPCIIVVPTELTKNSWYTDFNYWVGASDVIKFYFGDKLEPNEKGVVIYEGN